MADEHLLDFAAVMRRLRAECPWKGAQTHRSLARYLLEETHEALEAIDAGDADLLREELGDLLLQVYFHSVIAEESGVFTLDDVARGIVEKMWRRNPHVFSPTGSSVEPAVRAGLDPAAVNEAWEAAKADEKQRSSVLDGLPPGLPALLLADKVLDRLARVGSAPGGSPGGRPGGADVDTARMTSEEVGEALLEVVEASRAGGVDPEQALRDAVRRRIASA